MHIISGYLKMGVGGGGSSKIGSLLAQFELRKSDTVWASFLCSELLCAFPLCMSEIIPCWLNPHVLTKPSTWGERGLEKSVSCFMVAFC